jgi:signal transduction histidine kinase
LVIHPQSSPARASTRTVSHVTRTWTTPWAPGARDAWRGRLSDVGCILVALVIGGLASDSTAVATSSYAEANEVIGLAAALALWWRRRAILPVAIITFVAQAFAPMAAGAAIVSVYTLAAYRRETIRSVIVLLSGLYLGGGLVSMAVNPDLDAGNLGGAMIGLLLTATAVGWGFAVRSRHDLMASLGERARRAEAERDARVAEARRAERTRIATEMHDMLAHRLSMLSLQAGAIELRSDADREALAQAAGVVRSNAHLALEDLRTVIGVLRYDEPSADLAPPPGASDLADLVAECRAAGMRIEVVDGSLDGAPMRADLGRHVYRIVQEGLTNARKHAAGQPVRLAITTSEDAGVDIEIANRVAPPAATDATPEAIPGAGVGLVGLRERVELVGGTLERTMDGGMHELKVELPWPT